MDATLPIHSTPPLRHQRIGAKERTNNVLVSSWLHNFILFDEIRARRQSLEMIKETMTVNKCNLSSVPNPTIPTLLYVKFNVRNQVRFSLWAYVNNVMYAPRRDTIWVLDQSQP